jgi:DNA (cytosine-5)-methyltransferase 1
MTYPIGGFDAIHASPPCQAYSTLTGSGRLSHPDLYVPTRDRLIESGVPYVIENVIGAPYSHGIVLCGSMFEADRSVEWVQRHRNFETSWYMFQPSCDHEGRPRPSTITGGRINGRMIRTKAYEAKHSKKPDVDDFPAFMGMPWATPWEATQAIPPAYTEWIGTQLLSVLAVVA